jgi:hypothetical protein
MFNFGLVTNIQLKSMAGKGGARLGAGRKSRAEELGIQSIAIQAITEHYGSLLEGFKALIQTNEPSLVKFVWEHAAGKPREKFDIEIDADVQHVQIIRLPDNGRDTFDIDNELPSAN